MPVSVKLKLKYIRGIEEFMAMYDDGISRVLNLIFILDGTENISDEDYGKECDFIRSCSDCIQIAGMDADVRAVIVPTSGAVIGPMPISELDTDPGERIGCDVGAMFEGLPEILRRCERLGPEYIVDNIIILVSNGRFLKQNVRTYTQLTGSGRFRRTAKMAVCVCDDADRIALRDFTGSTDLVHGTDIFDRTVFLVTDSGVIIRDKDSMFVDDDGEEENPHKLNRMNSEDSSDDVYDF